MFEYMQNTQILMTIHEQNSIITVSLSMNIKLSFLQKTRTYNSVVKAYLILKKKNVTQIYVLKSKGKWEKEKNRKSKFGRHRKFVQVT